ncbi:MAG: hypothetical protein JWR10_2457 [Rubritepida sp.]|nr:hypothetical protein [Rubritepida sp.]
MTTMTISAFARLQDVSRKTAYQWKSMDYLAFHGREVDVERSNERLAAAGLSRLKPATLRVSVSRQLGQRVAPDLTSREALIRHAHQFPCVSRMSVFAASKWDVALEMRAHLPLATVQAIVARVVATDRQSAYEIALNDGEGPPLGFASWADHPWFARPAMTEEDWQELEEEHRASCSIQASAPAPP